MMMQSKYRGLLFKVATERSKEIAKSSTDFMCLSNKLQRILLKNNTAALVTLRFAAYDNINDYKEHMKKSMGPNDYEIQESLRHHISKSTTIFSSDLEPLTIEFRNSNECFIKRLSEEEQPSLRSFIRRKVGCDQNLTVLLSYAALFSYDNYKQYLDDSEKQVVQHMQDNALTVVKRYLYTLYSSHSAAVKLNHAIETLTALRDSSEFLTEPDET